MRKCKSGPAQTVPAGMPEPPLSLSNVVPPKATEMANAEVVMVKNKAPCVGRSVPYLILTPAQR